VTIGDKMQERPHLLWGVVGRHVAEGRGGAIAIRSARGALTYAEVAGAIAHGGREIARRVPSGGRVLVASRDQLHVALGFLATLVSGRMALLADPTSAARLRDLAGRFGALPFVDDAFEGERGSLGALSRVEAWLGAREKLDLAPVAEREPAFWVFTSGTTGEPRPVVHVHGAPLAAYAGFARDVLGLCADDVTISTAGLPFVYALGNNLLFPLLAGASCILPEDLLLPTVLGAAIRHRATVLVAGPWSLEALARLAVRGERYEALRRLRLVLSAGEPLPVSLYREWEQRFGTPPIDNLGCTEMFNSFLSNRREDAVPGSLGRVVPGYEVEVGEAAPRPGATGPLRIRGASRACAVGDAELSAPRSASEWHETGDEVAVDAEGRFTFLGRRDHRFKSRGRFVHPVEIERHLLEVDGVRECLVAPEIDDRGLTVVAARVVPVDAASEPGLERRLLRHARSRLDPFQVPVRVTIVPSLPRNERGKLDRGSRSGI